MMFTRYTNLQYARQSGAGVQRHVPTARHRDFFAHTQRGAVLVVALMLLFIMSMLGIASMQSGTLDGRLAGNSIEKDLTLQTADSASEWVLSDENLLEETICAPLPNSVQVPTLTQQGVIQANAQVRWGGESLANGFSVDSSIAALQFIATGTATLDASGTQSSVSQGLFILGAKGSAGGC